MLKLNSLSGNVVVTAPAVADFGRLPDSCPSAARATTFGRNLGERLKQLLVCAPECVGSFLRQLDPVRTLHRLLGPKMGAFRRGGDDPGVIGFGIQQLSGSRPRRCV